MSVGNNASRRICASRFASLALLFFTAAATAADVQKFSGNAAEFTIAVPTNWTVMDPQILEALVDPYGADDSTSTGRAVRFGYAPAISEAVSNPPYIMVEVSKTVRLPDRIEALQANPGYLRTNILNGLRKTGVLERNLLETRYDTNRHMARFSFTKSAPFTRERLRVTKQVFFTEEGSIIVMAVCPELEWSQWSETIESALDSLQIAERLHYRLHLASSPHLFAELQTILIMGIAFIAIPIVYFFYFRRSDQVMSDEI